MTGAIAGGTARILPARFLETGSIQASPAAELVHQSLDDEFGGLVGIPTPLGVLFEQAYQACARIHSNSWVRWRLLKDWGTSMAAFMTVGGKSIVGRGITVRRRDMLIVFSAGNEGDFDEANGKMTVTSPSTAKNCLTIGALENVRPTAGANGDDLHDLARFSSRGPTRENRIKPDLVCRAHGLHRVAPTASKFPGATTWNPPRQPRVDQTRGWHRPAFSSTSAGRCASGTHAWQFQPPTGATFRDVLLTPEITVPTGHGLTLQVRVRGDISGLEGFQIGFRQGNTTRAYPNMKPRKFPNWTTIFGVPGEFQGSKVRFAVIATQPTAPLPANVNLSIDDFDLTTFSSWDSLANIGTAPLAGDEDKDFTYSGGTSMSAPIAAGCAIGAAIAGRQRNRQARRPNW